MNNSGQNPLCYGIKAGIVNDSQQIQTLYKQKTGTNDGATTARINKQITCLEQHIASLRQQAEDLQCF
jgi:hypothetical protein